MQKGIGRQIASMTILAGLLTAVLIFILSFIGQILLKNVIESREISLRASAKFESEKLAETEAEKLLSETAQIKAYNIDWNMREKIYDVEMLADKISTILKNPQNYLPRTLPNPNEQPIPYEVPYIYLAPDLRGNVDEKLLTEMSIASNIADDLSLFVKSEMENSSSCYVASKNGYLICADLKVGNNENVVFTKEFLESYDPRTRTWYIAAKNAGKTTFTDYYLAAEGYYAISVAAPYFDSQGFAGVAAINVSSVVLQKEMTEATHGETNFNIALDKNGVIIFSSRNVGDFSANLNGNDLRNNPESTIAEAAKRMTDGERGTMSVKINGEEYYLAFAPIPSIGWSFGTLLAAEEVQKPIQATNSIFAAQIEKFSAETRPLFDNLQDWTYRLTIFLLIFMLISGIWLTKRFSSPIKNLSDGVKEISGGNLDKKFDIHTGDEIEQLADGFNIMTTELKNQMRNLATITAEKERIAAELNIASVIQLSMLPNDFQNALGRNKFMIHATMEPAKEVGGDFYDFYRLDENHLAITIADVSGKGIPAALFMVISKTTLKNLILTSNESNLANLISHANDILRQDNTSRMFVTAFIGILDTRTGKLTYVNAGHNPPVLYRASENKFEYLSVNRNCVLAIRRGFKYKEQEIILSSGDFIFLYTDGVTEAFNEAEELYGEEKLLEALNKSADKTSNVKDLLAEIRISLAKYVGNAEQSDDITMLGLSYRDKN